MEFRNCFSKVKDSTRKSSIGLLNTKIPGNWIFFAEFLAPLLRHKVETIYNKELLRKALANPWNGIFCVTASDKPIKTKCPQWHCTTLFFVYKNLETEINPIANIIKNFPQAERRFKMLFQQQNPSLMTLFFATQPCCYIAFITVFCSQVCGQLSIQNVITVRTHAFRVKCRIFSC